MLLEYEEDEEDEDFLDIIVTSTKENVLAEGTRKNYENKIELLRNFVAEKHGTVLDDGYDSVIDYMNAFPGVLDRFLAFYSYKDPEKRTGIRAKSTVTNYVCAMKYLYKQGSMRATPSGMRESFKTYLAGFAKTRAKSAENGQTKQLFGKRPLSVRAYSTIAFKRRT